MTKPYPGLLVGANQYLGRPLPDPAVTIPASIYIEHDRLVWTLDMRVKRLSHPDKVLDNFYSLATISEPDTILNFAQQYGPLWLCAKHGIASWHRPLAQVRNAFGPAPDPGEETTWSSLPCAVGQDRSSRFYEPLARWRTLATRAFNLLLIANQLHNRKDPPTETWAEVDGSTEDFSKLESWSWLANPWNRLAENLNWWFECADVVPFVKVEPHHKLRLVLSYRLMPSALNIIAQQLTLAAIRAQGLFVCKGCGAMFPAKSPGGKYCNDCRKKKIPEREAARAYRRRLKAGDTK